MVALINPRGLHHFNERYRDHRLEWTASSFGLVASHLASQNVWVGIYLFQFLASVHARISKCRIWLCFAQWPSLCCAQLPGVLGWWRTDNSNQKFPGWRTSEFDPIGHRSHLASTPYLRGPHTSFVNRIAHTSKKLKKAVVRVDLRAHTTFFSIGHGESWFQDGSQREKKIRQKKT